ncbi:MAG: hypothetical protein EOP47_25880 [Sphingobacteriaceae bacterium]|nr:MAG: hypothetical protein EOP47_25880 [Sphingobacteriaceae bacterium]
MKGFLIKVTLFASLTGIVLGALSVKIFESEETSYVRGGIILKHRRLDSVKGRRIIFAGGSNLAFGLNSKAIQDTFKIPVTNLGLHVALGLDFMLGELKSVMREGDVIFISPEYYANEGRYQLKKTAARYYPQASQYFAATFSDDFTDFFDSKREQIQMNRVFLLRYLKERATGKSDTSVYSSHSFNLYGDVVTHLNDNKILSLKDKSVFNYRYWDGIAKINELAKYATLKKVKLYFLFPTYERETFNQNHQVLEKYQADVQIDLHIPVLNTVNDMVYNTNEYYDTVYHLRKNAREKRTQRVIEIIKLHPEILKP